MFRGTQYFTVFGGAYVPEHHNEYCFDLNPKKRASAGSSASWIVCLALLAGISVFAAEIALLRLV